MCSSFTRIRRCRALNRRANSSQTLISSTSPQKEERIVTASGCRASDRTQPLSRTVARNAAATAAHALAICHRFTFSAAVLLTVCCLPARACGGLCFCYLCVEGILQTDPISLLPGQDSGRLVPNTTRGGRRPGRGHAR